MRPALFLLLLLLLVGSLGLASETIEWNRRAGFGPWAVSASGFPDSGDEPLTAPLQADTSDFSLQLIFRLTSRPGSHSSLTLTLSDTAGQTERIILSDSTAGIPELAERHFISVSRAGVPASRVKGQLKDLETLTLARTSGELELRLGEKRVPSGPCRSFIAGIELATSAGSRLILHSGRFTHRPPLSRILAAPFPPASIDSLVSGAADPLAGYYAVYSTSLDTSRTGLGGEYRLALLPDGAAGYVLLYTGGATTASREWKPGMVKARLQPGTHTEVYDVCWYDSAGQPLRTGVKGVTTADGALRVIFPYQNSEIVLRRCAGDIF